MRQIFTAQMIQQVTRGEDVLHVWGEQFYCVICALIEKIQVAGVRQVVQLREFADSCTRPIVFILSLCLNVGEEQSVHMQEFEVASGRY